jgi:hypothetical protein
MGLRKWVYRLRKVLGYPGWVPKLGKKERFNFELAYLEHRVLEATNFVQATVFVSNSISTAGKTTTAIYLATIVRQLALIESFVVSATNNLRTVMLPEFAGVKRNDELSVRQLVDMKDEAADLRTVSQMTRRTSFGVRIVANDPPLRIEEKEAFGKGQFSNLIDKIYSVSEFIVFDGGNDNTDTEAITLEAMRRCDVPIFTANAEIKKSLDKLSTDMTPYRTDVSEIIESPGQVPKAGSVRSGKQIPTKEKVERAIVVITNTPKGKKPEDYRGYVIEGFRGIIMIVPHDHYVADIGEESPANPYKVNLSTYRAYVELAVAVFETAAELQGVKLPEPLASVQRSAVQVTAMPA